MAQIEPTYNFEDAIELMISLDYEGLVLLGKLITEEKYLYPLNELKYLQVLFDYYLSGHRHEEKR